MTHSFLMNLFIKSTKPTYGLWIVNTYNTEPDICKYFVSILNFSQTAMFEPVIFKEKEKNTTMKDGCRITFSQVPMIVFGSFQVEW